MTIIGCLRYIWLHLYSGHIRFSAWMPLESSLHEQNLVILLVYAECELGVKENHMQGAAVIGAMVDFCHTIRDKERLKLLCAVMFYMRIKHKESMSPIPSGILRMFSRAEAMFC